MKYGDGLMGWGNRQESFEKDRKREHKGFYYFFLSLFLLIGGMSTIIYGLVGLDWVQKPYVVLGAILVVVGFSIVVGGFGKVDE